jgi:MFS family permease
MDGSSLTLRQRLILALLAVLQNSLVGGLVYGWASIDRSLLVKDANLTFNETTAIFSWACSVGMFSSLLMGPILDHYGRKSITRRCPVLPATISHPP